MKDLKYLLEETSSLLISADEKYWSAKVQSAIQLLPEKPMRAISEVESWYGGMGSFNDLLISSLNGHSLGTISEHEANAKLAMLRGKLFQSTQNIRDLDRS